MKKRLSICIVTRYVAHLFELTHGQREEGDKLLLVLADANTGNLRQAFQRHIAEHGHIQKLKTVETKLIHSDSGNSLNTVELL